MPVYKKKKRNRLFSAHKKSAKRPLKKKGSDDIVMTPSKKERSHKSVDKAPMRVVKGKKLERSRKNTTLLTVVAAIVVVVLCLQLILPAGILQTAKNLVFLIGRGNYPISVSGAETLSVDTQNNYFFHLTDSHLSAYSTAGKILFSEQHGFDKPILVTSKGKALLYNQDGQQYSVFDINGRSKSFDTEEKIICATISDSGYYAVVTYSKQYASAVTVFNKRGSQVYEWYSAEDTINSVALSSTGKRLAVSTFNSSEGVLNSKLNIIGYKSATPEYSLSYENDMIYSLNSTHKSTLCVIKSNGMDFIGWSNRKRTEHKDEYNISYFRKCGSSIVGVFNRESDYTDNKIMIFSKKGRLKKSVTYKGVINDIRVKGSNIYCINDSAVSVLDFDGAVKYVADYGYGGTGITVISANVVAVITDNEIKRVKLSAN